MDLAARLDVVAEEVMQRYQLLLSTFVAHLARTLDTATPTSQSARHELETKLLNGAGPFYEFLHERLKREMLSLTADALAASKARLSIDKGLILANLLQDDLDNTTQQIISLEMRDEARVKKLLRDLALQVSIATARKRTSYVGALIAARHGKVATLQFRQTDRSGRAWNTAVYLRTLVRMFLLHVYIESFLYGRAEAGSDLAKVTYADPEHEFHGLVFSISGATDGYPSYEDIKDKVFHPNSVANVEVK
jgi:hypothetical protein